MQRNEVGKGDVWIFKHSPTEKRPLKLNFLKVISSSDTMWKRSTNKTSERKQTAQQNKGLWVYLVNRNKGWSLKNRLDLPLLKSYKSKLTHIQTNKASLPKLKIQHQRKKITEQTTQSKPSNH